MTKNYWSVTLLVILISTIQRSLEANLFAINLKLNYLITIITDDIVMINWLIINVYVV